MKGRTRGWLGWIGLLVALAAVAEDASAREELVVRRAPEASDCPTASELSAMVRALTPLGPEAALGETSQVEHLEVHFARGADAYRAVIELFGEKRGTRTLEHRSATCAPLAEATALTIAVLVDPDFVPPAEPPPREVTVPTEPAERAARPPPAKPTEQAPLRLSLDAGAGIALALVRPVSPVFVLDGSVGIGRFAVGLGGFLIPPQSLPLSGGSIDVWLLAGTGRACGWPVVARQWRAGACVAAHVGLLRAEGRGYSTDGNATRPWVAGGAYLTADGRLFGAIGWFARGGALIPVHRESFRIDGAGVAYEEPPVGGVFALGPTLTFL